MMRKVVLSLAAAGLLAALPASAQTVVRDWESHKREGYCYNVSLPKSASGAGANRGAYVAVRHDPSEGVRDSVSFVSGLDDVTGAAVTASVDGGKAISLLAFDNAAFAESGAPERRLIADMKRGLAMKVTWKLPSGATVSDTYSLLGFTATKQRIDDLCR